MLPRRCVLWQRFGASKQTWRNWPKSGCRWEQMSQCACRASRSSPRGIGEDIERLAAFPHLPMVLANSGVSISTPQVFAVLERRDNPPLPEMPDLFTVGDVCTYLAETGNHLFSAAEKLTPAIGDTMNALQNTTPRLVRMSGSGGTCFAIYDSDADAEAAAAKLKQSNPDWFVVATNSVMEGD